MRFPFRKAVFGWFLFIPFPMVNGYIRNTVIQPVTGELTAHQLSTVILVCVFAAYVYLLFRQTAGGMSLRQTLAVGCIWVGMTVLFEFGFGHFVMGNPWDRLFHDYDLTAGRIWSLFLAAEFFSLAGIRYLSSR